MFRKTATFCCLTLLTFATAQADVISQNKHFAGDPAPSDYFASSVAADGDTAVFGAPAEWPSGAVYVFQRSGSTWVETAKLTPVGASVGAHFGNAVSIQGNTIVGGACLDDGLGDNSGSAFVFERSGGTWTQTAKLLASDGLPFARFGAAVAVDGGDIIVGAPWHGAGPGGAAYLFAKSGVTWTETQQLTPNFPLGSGNFGSAVDIAGDSLIVGDREDDEAATGAGGVYFYDRLGGVWSLTQKILGSGFGADLGGSVAIDHNTALLASPMRRKVFVYTRGGGGWTLEQELLPSDPLPDGRFGISTDLNGDMALIAQVDYESNQMTIADRAFAYVFQRDEINWSQQERIEVVSELDLHAGSTGLAKEFVALSGCSVLVGTDRDDEVFSDAGAAHTYLLDSCPCKIAPGDMLSWWPLDESMPATSEDVMRDHDGMWVGAPNSVPGIVDRALHFGGHGSAVAVPTHSDFNFGTTRSFSLDAWIHPTKAFSYGPIVEKREPGSHQGFGLWYYAGRLLVLLNDSSGTPIAFFSSTSIPTHEWTFVAVSIDRAADRAEVWINDQLEGTFFPSTNVAGSLNNSRPLRLGSSLENWGFIGHVDEVEIFDRALDAAELLTIYRTLSGGKCKPCVEPPAEMSAWWPLDESVGFLSRDIAGGNHAEWNGSPTPSLGKVDRSLDFNGIDQHLKAPSHPSINFKADQSFTIDAWIRLDGTENGRGAIVSKMDPNTGVGYHLSHRSGRLIFSMSDGSSAVFNYVSPNKLPDNWWTFVAVTVDRDADLGVVYVDGDPEGTFVPSATAAGSIENDWALVMAFDVEGYRYRGRIDEVEIFRRALSEDEVRRLWIVENAGKCKPEKR